MRSDWMERGEREGGLRRGVKIQDRKGKPEREGNFETSGLGKKKGNGWRFEKKRE